MSPEAKLTLVLALLKGAGEKALHPEDENPADTVRELQRVIEQVVEIIER